MTPPETGARAATSVEAARDGYLGALLAPDPRGAWQIVQDALDAGVPAARVYLSVVAPAMVEIGALWETAQLSVAREHLATQITQSVLARLAPALEDGTATARGTAIVTGTPGEQHALGARMVADFLEGAGWDVLLLGPDTPAADVLALAAERRPEVVALSTALSSNLLAAAQLMGALRRLDPPPVVVAGGGAYDGDRRRALAAGADLFATDPESLLRTLAERR